MDASASALAVLGPSHEGTVSLIFESSAGCLGSAISFFGGDSVVAEPGVERGVARDVSPAIGSSPSFQIENPRRLPFQDASFDAVFLPSGLAWLPVWSHSPYGPAEVQERFLRECHRILKPAGRLVMATSTRLGVLAWTGRKDPDTGLRWIGLLPRFVAGAISRVIRGKPYREHVYTWRGYSGQLRRAGFSRPMCHVPWPRADWWEYIILDATGNLATDFSIGVGTLRWKIVSGLFRTLRLAGLHSPLFPDLFIVAAKEDSGELSGDARTLLGCILEGEGVRTFSNLQLRYRGSTESLTVETPKLFLKIPLSEHGVERQKTELRALRQLARTQLAPHTLQDARMNEARGVLYTVYPRVTSPPRSHAADHRRMERAFDLLFRVREPKMLRETATWSRIFSKWSKEMFSLTGHCAILDRMESGLADKEIPAGITHGDLKYGNLLERDGRLIFIDWDRFENPAPLLLDGMHALFHDILPPESRHVSAEQRYLGALERLLERPKCILVARVDSVLGGLDWIDAVTLYVVSYLQHWLSFAHALGRAQYAARAAGARLELCELAWRRA